MKRIVLSILAIASSIGIAMADEGMWLPALISQRIGDMQAKGFKLSAEDVYSVNQASLKDAVVLFGGGCTGEIVSDEGLLLTNHHCGYGYIQRHSSVEHDYLKDGFWAMDRSQELPNRGLSVSFLQRMEDVTDRVLKGYSPSMSEAQRDSVVRVNSGELVRAAMEEGKGLRASVEALYYGNQYFLFVFKIYRDVRLVGAPPSSIGKFGGDTDNWMWPRHTGDFSIFRVYADKNGNPAAYSKDNVPLTPKHHLPISLDGVKKDDFTMIWGFPGSTERYMSSYGIDYNVDTFYPAIIDIFGKELEVMEEYMKTDEHINLMYADNHAGLANTWKNFIGQCKMLRKNKVSEGKVALEKDFTKWVNNNGKTEYAKALPNLKEAYKTLGNVAKYIYYPNFVSNAGPAGIAAQFGSYYQAYLDKDKDAQEMALMLLQQMDVDGLFAETDPQVEKKTFAEMLKTYKNAFKADELPEIYSIIDKKFKGDIDAFTDDVYTNSIFATPESIKAFIAKPNPKKIGKDYAYIMNTSMMEVIMNHMGDYRQAMQEVSENDHVFVKGLREYYAATQPEKSLYPDANSTMRMSYGSVQDYMPADAVHYDYVCTANGILEKYVPGDYEFDAPKRLISLIEKKDFGAYADDNGELVVCFLSTNDITGGNSGSPIMNGKGELIGLAFDGNWEAMSGDVNFEPKLQRTINVDIRYVLFIIDKYAGATNLIDELDIRRSEPKPLRVEEEKI